MNRRDEQIAEILGKTANLDQARLTTFYEWVKQAYAASSIVDQVAVVAEIEDRTPSDFHVLSNQELRRIDHFNGPTYAWESYCKELGRSVALAEERYLFETIKAQVPDVDVSNGIGFDGLHEVIATLKANGHVPDVILAPIAYMIGFYNSQQPVLQWDERGRESFLSGGTPLRILWSASGRPLDRFIVFDHRAGTWWVKLDPHRNGGRLTVAIGEQYIPLHGVVWLAETVAQYQIIDYEAFKSFRPDAPLDANFDEAR